ncbi:MAG TPA: hypothetical protein VJR87_09055 [Allosphingosinicella sp.]|nr:hypothetical protein [Allosphingosinicella sp.]
MDPLQHLAVKPGFEPMEAKLVEALPADPGRRFEPKWDGFRCLIFRSGEALTLQSKSGKPLTGYFPEVAETVLGLAARKLVLDAEHLPRAFRKRWRPSDRMSADTVVRLMRSLR